MNYNYAEKYIKKPVVVEAFHYRKYYTDFQDLLKFCPDIIGVNEQNTPIIKTLKKIKTTTPPIKIHINKSVINNFLL